MLESEEKLLPSTTTWPEELSEAGENERKELEGSIIRGFNIPRHKPCSILAMAYKTQTRGILQRIKI